MPLVVTVHDLALLRHPDAFPDLAPAHGRGLRCAPPYAAADAIVAVSAFTRDELGVAARRAGGPCARRPERRGRGVHAGGAVGRRGAMSSAVGTLEPRKNLGGRRRGCADRGRRAAHRRRAGLGRGRRARAGSGAPSDDELAGLYRGARCLVYPSLYEGFGIPVLEAMACGTPVVTSRGGATEEVAGGAAVLVDAADPEAIAAGIAEAEARRAELVPLGLERARGFTWQHAADQVEVLWRELT